MKKGNIQTLLYRYLQVHCRKWTSIFSVKSFPENYHLKLSKLAINELAFQKNLTDTVQGIFLRAYF